MLSYCDVTQWAHFMSVRNITKTGRGECEKYTEWINIFPTTKSIHIDKYIYVFVYPYFKNSFLFFPFYI